MQVGRGANPRAAGPSWLTLRVVLLGLLVLVVGSFAAWRVAARWDKPRAGDWYSVEYEGDDGCGYLVVRADGLILRAQTDLSEPAPLDGKGTLVLDKVWNLHDGGYGTDGTLTLADGSELEVSGGTEGKVFFTLGCGMRGG